MEPEKKPKREGVKSEEDFGPGYIATEDERQLLERADAGKKLIYDSGGSNINGVWVHGVDPLEVLVAVVWPGTTLAEMQRARPHST